MQVQIQIRRWALFVIGLNGLILGGAFCSRKQEDTPAPGPSSPGASARPPPACADAGDLCPVDTEPELTGDIPRALRCTSQMGVECFAWQDFIALNWPAGQPADASPDVFGEPSDAGEPPPVVWQTYKNVSEVFRPNAAPPAAWDAGRPPPDCLPPADGGAGALRQAHTPRASNMLLVANFHPGSSVQPGGPQNWLADTSGNLVWYQIVINETEFDYIVDAGLYNAANQWAASVPGKAGVRPANGSMELKAAWRELTDPGQSARYLTTGACIPGPGGKPRWAQLGLVGLHIIHKVQPNWLWATFEQIDNAPDRGALDAGAPSDAGFSFYNPGCDPSIPIPAACLPDAGADSGPRFRSCEANTLPAYSLGPYFDGRADACAPYPTQVAREHPIPSDESNLAQQLNAHIQDKIRKANPNSVFQYYQIVNAMWWSIQTPGAMDGGLAAPLPITGLQPAETCDPETGRGCVANTVLETYVQSHNCLHCHAYATVAKVAGVDGGMCKGGPCAADFSFIFGAAELPSGEASDFFRRSGGVSPREP